MISEDFLDIPDAGITIPLQLLAAGSRWWFGELMKIGVDIFSESYRNRTMTITQAQADELKEIVEQMKEGLENFKAICRRTMSASEYQMFKYRTLGHLEPGLVEDSEWVTTYSSIDSLEKVANEIAGDQPEDDEEEEEEEETA